MISCLIHLLLTLYSGGSRELNVCSLNTKNGCGFKNGHGTLQGKLMRVLDD